MTRGIVLARAVSDDEDRLLSADEPLAGLQLRCGGDLPGVIAIPALLEAVRKARRFGLKLARPIHAQDGTEAVTAWVEVEPGEGEAACRITIRNWRTAPLPVDDPDAALRRRTEIDRTVAELGARLDARQGVLAVESEAADLRLLLASMRAGVGRPWTEFVSIEGDGHRQPLHWRLLDGAQLRIEGSERSWKAALMPIEVPGGEPSGFELYLVPETPLVGGGSPPAAVPARAGSGRLIGTDLAPVLRQPIARIIATAETIRTRMAGPLAEEYTAYAADISSAGQHLLALIEDMADLEVVESEGFTTAPDAIDLAEVARQAAGILGVRARERGISIEAPRADEMLPAVAEFRRVLQVLLNLIGNAIRYTPEGSQIGVRVEHGEGCARIIVADQGQGLSDQDQARLFEKFERLGRSGDGGSGLGLYISRRLARAMRGDLTVESAPGQGARFILEVPAGN